MKQRRCNKHGKSQGEPHLRQRRQTRSALAATAAIASRQVCHAERRAPPSTRPAGSRSRHLLGTQGRTAATVAAAAAAMFASSVAATYRSLKQRYSGRHSCGSRHKRLQMPASTRDRTSSSCVSCGADCDAALRACVSPSACANDTFSAAPDSIACIAALDDAGERSRATPRAQPSQVARADRNRHQPGGAQRKVATYRAADEGTQESSPLAHHAASRLHSNVNVTGEYLEAAAAQRWD